MKHLPVALVMLYGVLIIYGQNYYFAKRAPWNWRKALALWNFTLSFFSFCGMVRTVPQLMHNLSTFSLRDNLCHDPEMREGSGTTGLWVQLFVLSKIPELLDTFFIVIHKKPLIFLHWYHHVTVLLYSWYSYVLKNPSGLFSTAMNYTVHFVMYGYYFLMAIKSKPKWMNAMVITVMQIAQMVVGVVVMCLTYYFSTQESSDTCNVNQENNLAAFLMYGSYLFLFLEFFLKKYFTVRTKKIEKKVE
mmetsp:Transcript_55380/g.82396  ORF Transcript_55380/g.82396 Transcript_55380/m.82396 type:complete len:246 (+) Transcript_55380:331-1068(+)